MSNTQLPAEVSRTIEQQAHDATCALFSPNNYNEFTSYQSGYIKGATEYATKLLQVEQAAEDKIDKALHAERNKMQQRFTDLEKEWASKLHTARTLLSKFISRHEGALIITDPELYNGIKTFLDGTGA